MRSISVFLIFLSSIAVKAETLKVATFNAEFLYPSKVHIKYGFQYNMGDMSQAERDNWAIPLTRLTKYQQAVDVVAEVLKDIDVDVLTLTEIGKFDDVEILVEALKDRGRDYPHFDVCSCNDPTGQNVAILSMLPISDVVDSIPGREAYDLEGDDPDEQKDTGISKGMRVTVEKGGQKVHIYVLHLASERGGHEQDQQRIAQASIARRHAIPALNAGEHVIITGDLNDRRGQPTLRRLRGLDDIWPDLIQTGHWKFFEKEEEASRWTYQFRGEFNQIDHILLSYSLRKNQSSSIRSHVKDILERDNPSISDHRPLIVEIDLP
ncbi:endonuclease/exonuclease/phosphatase family protein [Marinicella sp. W31]|uniref:endonuclease/exonuclease/phosphatase family protein n=1 Tax=Marinicella sp. W31 TaxID=3023713 RepID=UPI003757D290